MIRIILRGRTGNNLFQYALGRALAEKHGVPLVLDASWFNSEGWAEVSHFLKLPIKAKVLRPILPVSLASRALRNYMGKHYWEYLGFPVLREPVTNQSFDQRFTEASDDCMLSGFFQSPRYFAGISTSLRTELNGLFADALELDGTLRRKMTEPGSVAVHVRRGDYMNIPDFQVCDNHYYRKSMDEMRARIPDPRFFVFSDDPEWCRSEFKGTDTEVIDSGEVVNNPLHDLHLMSLARHHIIANSSYSWWAAWLADAPGQQVIMPDKWFKGGIIAPAHEKKLDGWKMVSGRS